MKLPYPLKAKKATLIAKCSSITSGKEHCRLTNKIIEKTLKTIKTAVPSWFDLIDTSFLTTEKKEKYKLILQKRITVLGME